VELKNSPIRLIILQKETTRESRRSIMYRRRKLLSKEGKMLPSSASFSVPSLRDKLAMREVERVNFVGRKT
jgi:hypothetical protein